jgi:hypothetical protein
MSMDLDIEEGNTKMTPTEIDTLATEFIDSFQVPLWDFLMGMDETKLPALRDEISKRFNGTGKYDLIYDLDMLISQMDEDA